MYRLLNFIVGGLIEISRSADGKIKYNFHIRTVYICIIKVLFIHQLKELVSCLKNNIKIYYISFFLPVQYFNYLFIFQLIALNCHFL